MADNPLIAAIKKKLDEMPSEQRTKTVKYSVFALFGLVFFALYYLTGQQDKKPQPKPEVASVISLGDARLEDDIRISYEKQRAESAAQDKRQNDELQERKAELERMQKEQAALSAAVSMLASNPGLGLPATTLPEGAAPADPASWEAGLATPGSQNGGAGNAAARYALTGSPSPQGGAAQQPIEVTYEGDISSTGGTPGPAPADVKKKARRYYLAPGFMDAVALTGLAAKTVDGASSNPEPILLRVQSPAVLPNDVRAQLKGCLIVAHGFGSLASERVETQLVSISCINYDDRSMIDAELKGMVVDADGVKGLAAHPVSKMGTNLARLAFANAIQAAGAAFASQATTTSTSPLGQTQSIDPSKIGTAGIGGGVSKVGDEYARIISDLVRQQAPVLETGPGKAVTVVLTEGVWLEIKDFQEGVSDE